MGLFNRKNRPSPPTTSSSEKDPASLTTPDGLPVSENQALPVYNHNGHLVTKRIHPDGESGRSGVHPIHFVRVAWASSSPVSKCVNVLWGFVPAAIVLHFARPDLHVWVFAINYIAMVPCANLLGFAGQELARKLPKVAGILIETMLGSVVEIVLFMVLIVESKNPPGSSKGTLIGVIQAAILGSILTNLLLCLGFVFFVGGMKRKEQTFHANISEVGSGILLVAAFGLLIPSAFYSALKGSTRAAGEDGLTMIELERRTLQISQAVAIVLMAAFFIYIWFNARTHDNIFSDILEADEEADEDRHEDLAKPKFTFTESVIAILLSLTFISLISIFLVEEIEFIVKKGHVPDNFLGLILVPLVEKFAEHLTAVDEAYDNQINFALFHCLGPSIQTALFNAPLVVIVGWGLGKDMDLNFEIFMVVVLVLSILVVGNFLRDQSSNYLEGALLILVYIIVAVTTWFYPNADETSTNSVVPSSGGEAAARMAKMMLS